MNDDKNLVEPEVDEQPLTLREALASIFAAAVGVQSNKNRERDFRRGNAGQYIVLGVLATLAFVAAVYLLVRLVLAAAAN